MKVFMKVTKENGVHDIQTKAATIITVKTVTLADEGRRIGSDKLWQKLKVKKLKECDRSKLTLTFKCHMSNCQTEAIDPFNEFSFVDKC